ncbi:MAG: glycosyltransferase family 4 protein [Candidatus Aenigmatarchaeota archaeon]
MKYRVLLVHEIFYPTFSGGAERILLEIIERISNFCSVTVLTTGDPSVRFYRGIPTYRVKTHRYFFNIFSIPYLFALGKKHDIIIANTYHSAIPSFIVAKVLKKPVVLLVHGCYRWKWLSISRVYGILAIFFEKIIFSLPFDKIIFFSEFSKLEGLKLGAKNCTVITPGISIKSINIKNLAKEDFVLFVGRLEKQKGIDRLIEIAKLLPSIKFIIIGKGKLKDKLSNVIHLGFVPDKVLKRFYRQAFIFFLPSRAETLGYSILEAMSHGCLIISTVPLKYHGFCIKKFNIPEVKDIFIKIYRKKNKYKKIGLKNIEIVKKYYKWEGFILKLLGIIKNLISRKR